MTKRTTKNPTRRFQVEQEMAEQLAAVTIPSLSEDYPLVSITRLELTRDLKDGTLWVTAAPTVDPDSLVIAMTAGLPAWRQAVRRRLSLRYFPNLTVRYDEGQADLIRIEQLLEADAHKAA